MSVANWRLSADIGHFRRVSLNVDTGVDTYLVHISDLHALRMSLRREHSHLVATEGLTVRVYKPRVTDEGTLEATHVVFDEESPEDGWTWRPGDDEMRPVPLPDHRALALP